MNSYYHTAREAGKKGLTIFDPEPATIYTFSVMHMSITDKSERDLVEAIDCSRKFDQAQLMMEYVSGYLEANDISWGSFTVDRLRKYDHERDDEDSYHYVFSAIVKPRIEEA